MKDKIFQKRSFKDSPELEKEFENGFVFNEKVAAVFDDMANRSIPFYKNIIALIVEISPLFLGEKGLVYDLGCSTGTCLLALKQYFEKEKGIARKLHLVGMDNSKPMLSQAIAKLAEYEAGEKQLVEKSLKLQKNISLVFQHADLTKASFEKDSADMILLNYTLQFLSKPEKKQLLQKIYDALKPGGIFFLSEKVIETTSFFTTFFNTLYFNFKKRKKYSESEIARKRTTLLNTLSLQSCATHLHTLKKVGFQDASIVFKWSNFASCIAIKDKNAL